MARASRFLLSSCACSRQAPRYRATAPSSGSPWLARGMSGSRGLSPSATTPCASCLPTATTPDSMSGSICARLAKRKRSAGRNTSRTLPPSASPVSSSLGLLCEQRTLPLDAAGIAGQRPVGSDHAMTGDCHGDAVRAACPRHGAHSLRLADGLGDLRIACRRADRNAAERVPHAMLKRSSADVQGKVESDAWILDEADHFGDELLEGGIVADQLRTRELLLEVARKLVGAVAKKDGAHAAVARGNEH